MSISKIPVYKKYVYMFLEEMKMRENDKNTIDNTTQGLDKKNAPKAHQPELMDNDSLKDVTGGGEFDDFPRVGDNDYDDDIRNRG